MNFFVYSTMRYSISHKIMSITKLHMMMMMNRIELYSMWIGLQAKVDK